MKLARCSSLAALLLIVFAGSILADEMSVTTGDKLGLAISENGTLKQLSVDGKNIARADTPDFCPLSVCDVTKGSDFIPAKGPTAGEANSAIVQNAAMDSLSLKAAARYEASAELIRVKLSVTDTTGADRGLYVRFALPVDAEGWSWWDDMATPRKIGPAGAYENSRAMREFASMPEWRDKPALKMGSYAVNFCTVITGPAGLCYAVPLDQPRIFRTGYDADKKLFYIVYDVALAKEMNPPGTADFTFYLYRCDPAWGMRGALDRYYRLFPQFFAKHVKQDGMWMAFSRLSEIDNVNEFRFQFQEGAPEPAYDDKLGVDDLTYFTHAGMFANIPGYNPEKDPPPAYDRQLAAMRDQFKRTTGRDGIFDESGLFDAEGKLAIMRTSVYGHIIAQFNLCPQLAYGHYMLDRIPEVFASIRKAKGGELDGFYYDGITTGINYRREHFKTAGFPPIWDPVNKKPFLYNYFSSTEFAKEAAERLHAMGKITMMNGAMGSSFYTAPYLDVMGEETGLRIDRASFNYARTVCRQKPFVTLLKGNFSKLTHDDFVLFMRRCVAFGVFPGYFDWPPSGLGPGSQYWGHAEWYERDRLAHRKYQTLAQRLAAAGWEPLTLATSSAPGISIERFGSVEKGEIFLSVLNDGQAQAETVISIPSAGLPPDWVVVDEDAQQRLDAKVSDNQLQIPLNLGPESLAVLHLASKQRFAASQTAEILKNLDLRKQMTKIDADRPELLVHWRAVSGGYERDRIAGKPCLKLSNKAETESKGAKQWVMLYQDQPDPLVLRLKLKCDNVKPAKGGQFAVLAALAHVNMKTHFTVTQKETYDLDAGAYDWRTKEIVIKPERPLRSIELTVSLKNATGTAWIDEVSITPQAKPDHEYVVDPKLEQWYDPLPADRAQDLDAKSAEIEESIRQLAQATPADIPGACAPILGKLSALRAWITDNKLENPCRRALREADDATARLALVYTALKGISGPKVLAPDSAVPGEEIAVTVEVAGLAGEPVDYALDAPKGWACKPTGNGRFLVSAPAEAVGAAGEVRATALIGDKPDQRLALIASKTIQVRPALDATMRLDDISTDGRRFDFVIEASNNGSAPLSGSLKTKAPDGWRIENPAGAVALAPKTRTDVKFSAVASEAAVPGLYEIGAELAPATQAAPPCAFSQKIFFVPGSANRLQDPGFEKTGAPDWSKNEKGFVVDTSVFHSGKQSLRLSNDSPTEESSASQTITLNQKTPCPIIVRGHAKAEKVSGHPDKGFALYVDIYYTDGTPLYGNTFGWQTETTGWQYGEMVIEPAKPIRNVNVYCLFRGHAGTARFDDLFVAEDPTRQGNLARMAKASVDSCYEGYSPATINDGVSRTENIHWTEEAWASADNDQPHWIELAFEKPTAMKRVLIFWSMDQNIPRTSRKIELQSWDGAAWQKICDKLSDKAEPSTLIELPAVVTTQKLRLLQPAAGGSEERPNLMWVREIEIYEK